MRPAPKRLPGRVVRDYGTVSIVSLALLEYHI
ncbi:hypothetical protein BH23GEM8_BH23GEM8_03520 [soil metagenome]